MAEVKSSLVQSIKADTKKIAANTKHFGPKLPSKDESSERDEHVSESLDDMSQMIVGSFAQLIFGQSGKRKVSELLGLIGKSPDNTLFGNIADIAKAFGAERGRPDKRVEFSKQFAAGFADSKRYWTSFENSVKSSIANSLTDLKIIELLQLITHKIDNKANEKKLTNEIAIKFQETKTLTQLIEALDALGNLNINKKAFNNLEKIDALTKPTGQLAQILKNIENLNANAKKINSATAGLESIKNLITALRDSTKIRPKDVIRFRMNMFWIKHFIIDSLIETIEELSTINAKTVKEQQAIGEALKNFNAIFDSLMKVTSMGLIKSLRIHFGLRNIQLLIETSLKETLETLSKVLNNNKIIQGNDLKKTSLGQFIEVLNFLNDVNNKYDIGKIRSKFDELNSLVANELTTLMKLISNKDFKVVKETQKFESLQFNIESLVHLGDFLPAWLSLFSMIGKMNFMIMYADELGDLSTYINKIPKITIAKTQWTDMSEKHISGLVQIGSLLSNADFEKYSEDIKKSAKPCVNEIIKLFNDIEKFKGLDIDINRLKEISKYLTEFNKLPFDELPKQTQLIKILDVEKVITEFVKNFKGDAFAAKEDVDAMLTNIRALTIEFSSKGEIGKYLPEMIDITKNDINKVIQMSKYFDTLAKTAKKLAVIDKLMNGINEPSQAGIAKLANVLKTAIETFQDIDADEKKLELLEKSLQVFTKLVVMSAAVLLFGGLMMMVIPVTHVMLFAITLGAFVWSTMKVFKSMDKEIKLSIENAKAFTILLVASAATLLFAGFIMKYLNPAAVIAFAILEFAFIWALTLPYKKFAEDSQLTFDAANGFATLVIASGILMVLGSLLFTEIDWGNVFGFSFATALFVTAMSLAFIIPKRLKLFKIASKALFDFVVLMTASATTVVLGSLLFSQIKWKNAMQFAGSTALFVAMMILAVSWPKLLGGGFKLLGLMRVPYADAIGSGLSKIDPMKTAMAGAKDFAVLILACGLTMSIGAFIAKKIPFDTLFGFAKNLALFMGMIIGPLILAKRGISIAEHTGKEFAKIIMISAATMIIGGLLFTWFPGIKQGVLEFAIVHGLYMMAIGFTLKGFDAMDPKKLLKNAGILMLITVVTAGTLLYGAKVMADNPSMTDNLLIFAGCLVGYIIVMGTAAWLLSKIEKDMRKLVIAIGLMTVVTIAAAYALSLAADMAHKYSWDEIGVGILALIGGIGLIGLAYWAMGYAAFIDGGIGLGLAAVALTAISGLTFLTVKALTYIADNQSKLSVNTITKFKKVVKEFASLGKTVASEFFGLWTLKIPFVSATVLSLSMALSSIARAVEQYANLKVAVYEGTKVVGYRQLKESDFKSAAKNVRLVITTLGSAVIDTYNKKPEIFETNFFGQSKFSKVTKSLGTLGPMLASIAKAVKTYANLQVGEDYKKNDAGILVPTRYRQLKEQDFKDAAKNVKEIIVTLGSAVIDAYDKKPEIFKTNLFGTSKFAKVTKSLSTLSPLISSIAKSVKTYADLKIADYGDQVKYVDGKPQIQRYIPIGKQDFENAAANVTTIISTLGGAIIDAYEAHPDYYESSLLGSSKFAKTVNANITLAKLISRIGKAVADMSNLKVATDWYTEGENIGKPKAYEQLKNSHFALAAKNILTIITTLGQPIEEIANDPKRFELYDSATGAFGIGGTKSKFMKVIEGNIKLADLISKIGRAVKEMANLNMAEEYNTKGEGKKWRQLDVSDFKAAARNILAVITTLGEPIEKIANGHNFQLYEDCAGFIGIGAKKSKFITVINGNLKLAELISKIGSAVKDMANLRIPTGYDEKGKATGYEVMTAKHFRAAAKSINAIITTLGESIITSYNDHKEWFEDGEDSIFAQACTAIGSMGNMISQIAGGISAYAQLKIPNWAAGVNEDGTPKQYMKMNKKTFTNAANTINSIVTTIGQTVIDTYTNHEKWFKDGEDSDFVRACTAIGHMGEMIGSIAEGIKSYAELKIPIKYDKNGKAIDFRELKKTDFENASKHISTVISTIGGAIIKEFDTHRYWFLVKSEGDTTPFQRVIEGCTAMGEMISSIAEGVQKYGEGKMPIDWDNNGKPIEYVKLDEKLYEEAATNIAKVITCIGTAIEEVTKGELFTRQNSTNVINNVITMYNGILPFIGKLSTIISNYASLKMPEFNANGEPTKYVKMKPTDISEAGKTIGSILEAIGTAIVTTVENHSEIFGDKILLFGTNPNPKASPAYRAALAISEITKPIATMSQILAYYSMGKFPYVEGVDNKGKPILKLMPNKFDYNTVKTNIENVLLAIVTPLHDVINNDKVNDVFTKDGDKTLGSLRAAQITAMANQITALTKAIANLGEVAIKDSTDKLTPIKNIIGKMLLEVAGIAKIFGTPLESLPQELTFEMGFGGSGMFFSSEMKNLTLGQYLNKINNDKTIKNTSAGITAIKSAIESIFLDIKSLVESYNKNKTFIELFVNQSIGTNIKNDIEAIVNAITSTVKSFDTISIDVAKFDEKYSNLMNAINKTIEVFAAIDNMHKNYDQIMGQYLNGNEEFKGLQIVVEACRKAISTLYDYTGTETPTLQFGTPFAKWVSEVDSEVNINDLTRQLNNFNSTVRQLVEIAEYSDETGIGGYNIMITGLDGLITKIATIPKEDNFKTHVELLERYVQAINKIDLSRIISLNNLGITLNTLATKMGNLDKLTESLANKLAVVLNRLVAELKHAEKTIDNAKKLQEKRHELIKQATDEVKSIMNQKMLVEIKQVQDETFASDEGESGYSSESGGNGGSPQSGSTGGIDNGGGTSVDESYMDDKSSTPAVNIKTNDKFAPKGNKGGNVDRGNNGSQMTSGAIEEAILRALRRARLAK